MIGIIGLDYHQCCKVDLADMCIVQNPGGQF